jgi:dihydrodipicolinate reductase
MKIILVGSGDFAKNINKNFLKKGYVFYKLEDFLNIKNKPKINFIIYCGSERLSELATKVSVENRIPIILLSTGLNIELFEKTNTYFLPNTSLEILSWINLIKDFAFKNKNLEVSEILESHQKNKKDISGTAKYICDILKVDYSKIKSIRNKNFRHAYHTLVFRNKSKDSVFSFQKKIKGLNSYIEGLDLILNKIKEKKIKLGIQTLQDLNLN